MIVGGGVDVIDVTSFGGGDGDIVNDDVKFVVAVVFLFCFCYWSR